MLVKLARNIPNILTILRIFLAIFLLFFILHGESVFKMSRTDINHAEALIFLSAALTDFLDGYIARNYHLKTLFGEIFDPLADKILILAAFLGLLYLSRINPWIPFVILGREFFIAGLRISVSNMGKSIAVSRLGKYKTFLQIVAIASLLDNLHLGNVVVGHYLVALALFATLYSGMDYVIKYYRLVRALEV
ncbi:CDP-diacylglycerol--glycerol-3-phosphate 3-phosphatidyltransferase [Helicobacter cynogastricus]|uniref:CDP-diacylglycerol--glycerol-3-phosphate 3-phosphatidyltransferase n=1 Tax=Helicobacter cynogastricus TaxID=329937 RepID=UPI000CF16854|nr:CDP-diacylglycerol--glycerol-3-phosphate 3-phosphatidyltransferase [Helicobacter cynogastricus]